MTSGRPEHGWADQVARLVREQFEVVLGGTTYSRRKVLAGVVLDWEGKTSVVCVATGTKCISGEQLCLAGSVLNDCHAEVVARYTPSSGLLTTNFTGQALHGGLAVRPARPGPGWPGECAAAAAWRRIYDGAGGHPAHVHIHGALWRRQVSLPGVDMISDHNCFTLRIFSLHEAASSTAVQGDCGSTRGKLRSKIESGMGTVPLPEGGRQQTWDGVMSGERLLTMSCSDK